MVPQTGLCLSILCRGELEGLLECSTMLPEFVRIIAFLWEGSPDAEIVPENRALHSTAVSSYRYVLSR